jgi:Flp pilus assembly protein TadG
MRGNTQPTSSKSTAANWLATLFGAEAAQLVEFALVLPLLWALVVGAYDFGAAYLLKEKLTNAAREGARIGASQATSDLTQTAPPSVQAIRDAVVNYLTDANVTACAISTTPTPGPGVFTWSYSSSTTGCASSPVLVIERGYTFTATISGSPAVVPGTRVTLNYPFSWTFSSAIKLLAPSSSYANSITISTNAVMQNL